MLKGLIKYLGLGKGVMISFNVELLGMCLIWDELNDILIIKGLFVNLCD